MHKPPEPLALRSCRFVVVVALLLYLSVLFSMNAYSAHLVVPQALSHVSLDAAAAGASAPRVLPEQPLQPSQPSAALLSGAASTAAPQGAPPPPAAP